MIQKVCYDGLLEQKGLKIQLETPQVGGHLGTNLCFGQTSFSAVFSSLTATKQNGGMWTSDWNEPKRPYKHVRKSTLEIWKWTLWDYRF